MRSLWRRKAVIALSGIVFAALALVAAVGTPTRYLATGQLMANVSGNNQADLAADRATQVDVLRSPALLERTMQKLGLTDQPALIPHSRFAPAIAEITKTVTQQLQALLARLDPDRGTTAAVPSAEAVDGERADGVLRYLQTHIVVGGTETSRVLSVAFEAGTPELAASVANELMRQYITRGHETTDAVTQAQLNEVSDRAKGLQAEIAAADRKVQTFQQSHNVYSLAAGTPAALQLTTLQQQLAAARVELTQAQSALEASRNRSKDTFASPALQALTDRETDVLQRIARAGQIGSSNPRAVAMDEELRAVRAQIGAETRKLGASLERDYDAAQRKVASLEAAVNTVQADASGSGSAQLDLDQLRRDAEAKRTLYQSLLSKGEDLRVAAAQLPAGQIVSTAKVPLKSQPSMALVFVVFGFAIGALFSVGVIVLRSLLSARFPSARSLAYATGMPSLGSLPSFGQGRLLRRSKLAEIEGPSPIGETLRGMRLTLQNLARPGSGTVVLVTSAEAGEGKTTVAAALARRSAGDGLRVLLIEGDLRRPSLSHIFQLKSSPNIEAVLRGNDNFLSTFQVDARSGLHCLVARGDHPNPGALLASDRCASLMAYAKQNYDLVVIDSPPALRVADPISLSRWADLIVFAVRAEETAQSQVIEALSRFPEQCQSRVVTLLTRARINHRDLQGYYTGYSRSGRISADGERSGEFWEPSPRPALKSSSLPEQAGEAL